MDLGAENLSLMLLKERIALKWRPSCGRPLNPTGRHVIRALSPRYSDLGDQQSRHTRQLGPIRITVEGSNNRPSVVGMLCMPSSALTICI